MPMQDRGQVRRRSCQGLGDPQSGMMRGRGSHEEGADRSPVDLPEVGQGRRADPIEGRLELAWEECDGTLHIGQCHAQPGVTGKDRAQEGVIEELRDVVAMEDTKGRLEVISLQWVQLVVERLSCDVLIGVVAMH